MAAQVGQRERALRFGFTILRAKGRWFTIVVYDSVQPVSTCFDVLDDGIGYSRA
jgi:hypothetical protein